MSASLGLYRLQQIDRQMDQFRAQAQTIRRALENDSELQAAFQRLEAARAVQRRADSAARNAEAEVKTQRTKIEQAESSLYGGRVQNPKELQDLQKDIVSLKKYLTTLEEREFEALMEAEKAEAALQKAAAELELLQGRLSGEHKRLLEEESALTVKLGQLTEEREAALSNIEEGLLQIYETLRRQKRGVAVAEVSENSCAACGASITASLQQQARSQTQLERCPTCGRILYAN